MYRHSTVRIVDALPLFLPRSVRDIPLLAQRLPGFVAAAIEAGFSSVVCDASQFDSLAAGGVPVDLLSIRVKTESDVAHLRERSMLHHRREQDRQSQDFLAPLRIEVAVPSGEVSSRVLFGGLTYAKHLEETAAVVEAAKRHGWTVSASMVGCLSCPVEGSYIPANRVVEATNRLRALGVDDVRWEDGGLCEPRMVENLLKTAYSAGIGPESCELFLRSSDSYRARASLAKALLLGATRFCVVSGASGPRDPTERSGESRRALPWMDSKEFSEWALGTVAGSRRSLSDDSEAAVDASLLALRDQTCRLSDAAAATFFFSPLSPGTTRDAQ